MARTPRRSLFLLISDALTDASALIVWRLSDEGKGAQAKIRKFCHMHPLAPLQRGPWLSLARTVVQLGKRFPNYAQGTGWPQQAQEGADRARQDRPHPAAALRTWSPHQCRGGCRTVLSRSITSPGTGTTLGPPALAAARTSRAAISPILVSGSRTVVRGG